MTSASLLHLQRLSTEDGPGIRTTVFFKGCPLNCAWCHNPESISSRPQVQWFSARCIDCRTCLEVCPQHALYARPQRCLERSPAAMKIDRTRCDACGDCARVCPSGALEMLGQQWTLEALLAELVKDRAFYENSGGGVTLSGGEPTLQPEFAEALLAGLKAAGIATALDTCGLCSRRTLERLLPHTDLLLYDLKIFDPAAHQRHTGVSNEPILENLHLLGAALRSGAAHCRLWVRTPLIPGATDAPANLAAIGAFLAAELGAEVERWELCAFNNLCRDQYTRLGLDWAYARTPLLTPAELVQCEQAARASGFPPERILATGATRLEG